MTLIMKFGGTSVGSAEAIRRTAELIRQGHSRWPAVVVVLSAMNGVTDLLVRGATTAAAGDAATYRDTVQVVRRKHYQIISELLSAGDLGEQTTREIERFLSRYEALCKAVLILGEVTPRAMDTMSSVGEQMSVRLLAAYLCQLGQAAQAVDATELIVTDDGFQSATPLFDETSKKTEARLRPLLIEGADGRVTE